MFGDPFANDPFFSDNGFGGMNSMMQRMRNDMRMDMDMPMQMGGGNGGSHFVK